MAGAFRLFPQGDDPEWAHLYQILGTFTGRTKWSRLLNATGMSDDTNWFLRLRNRGSGGKHLRIEKSTDGSTVLSVDDTGITLNGTFTAVPVGVPLPYAGSSVPSKFLLCNGQAVSRTTYALLFAAIGTTWGAGDGSTTFNVPDLRGRFPLGVSGSFALGTTGGSSSGTAHTHPGSHSHGLNNHTHGMSHTHPGSHSHGMNNHTHEAGTLITGGPDDTEDGGSGADIVAADGHGHDVSGNTGGPNTNSTESDSNAHASSASSTGTPSNNSSESDSNAHAADYAGATVLPPYAALNYIIYAAV